MICENWPKSRATSLPEIRQGFCRELGLDLPDEILWWWFTVYREHVYMTPHPRGTFCRWCDGIANADEAVPLGQGERLRRYVQARYIEEG